MNLGQLRTFAAAAESLNFTHTARSLGLSQPAISQQVRDLEEELGVALFERLGRTLALTPAGERLRGHAMRILQDLRAAEEELLEFRGAPQGVLRVGAESTPGVYLMPHALGAFARSHPGVRTCLRIEPREAMLRGLIEGALDVAILEDAPRTRLLGWDCIELLKDELVVIVPPEHPWASRGNVRLGELASQRFILRQGDSPLRRFYSDRMLEVGFDPDSLKAGFELDSTEGIKQSVMAGLGVGFASRFAVASEVRAGRLAEVRLQELALGRTFCLLRPRRIKAHQDHFVTLLTQLDWLPEALGERASC